MSYSKLSQAKRNSKMKLWARAREKLKKIYWTKEITRCELGFEFCTKDNYLGFAHRYKRNDPRCKHTFNQTILACNSCHREIEYNRELSEEMFKKLR